MSERPIIFSAPMVRAILKNRKTQTRRIVKPSRKQIAEWGADLSVCTAARVSGRGDGGDDTWLAFDHPKGGPYTAVRSPFGKGDTLWVREAWAHLPRSAYALPKTVDPADGDMAAYYRCDFDRSGKPRWRPSIHMPRWASRITLRVTAVRVERLHDISEDDARAEGVTPSEEPPTAAALMTAVVRGVVFRPHVSAFANLWNSLHGPVAWDANPWVVAVDFKRIEAPDA